jgi:hypothetical protein
LMQHGPAASSGSNPKAPGSAGGYLLHNFDVVLGDKRFNACHVVIIHTIHIDEIVGKAP